MASVTEQIIEQALVVLADASIPKLTAIALHESVYYQLYRETFSGCLRQIPESLRPEVRHRAGMFLGAPIQVLPSSTPIFVDGSFPIVATYSDQSIRVLRVTLTP